jgi:predicted choloylglycine hydrolase
MKQSKILQLLLFVIFFTIILSCRKNDEDLSQNTLNSLRKINDYPFYTMTYYGDYGFQDYLRTGRYPFPASATAIAEDFKCTCFAAMGSDSCRLFGRNFDWTGHIALLLFTHPSDGYASVSMVDLKYFGFSNTNLPDSAANKDVLLETPYWPEDGMNECGVAIGEMTVERVDPPYDPDKITIYASTHPIRLVLDYAKNVDEAINLLSKYNISYEYSNPIHFQISDADGNSAIIEFLDKDMKVIRNTDKWQVSTNFLIYGLQSPESVGNWRYNLASALLKEKQGNITTDEAMNLLYRVSAGPPYSTMWSMIYNQQTKEITAVIDRDYTKQYVFNIGNDAYSVKGNNSGACCLPNIALNKPVTSSSNENSILGPGNAVDGDMKSRWSSGWSDPQWIKIDLETLYNVNGVTLFWETACAKKYQVQVSSDDSEWTQVYSTDSSYGGTECISFASVNARYIRMYGTERWTPYGYSLWEFQVHGK